MSKAKRMRVAAARTRRKAEARAKMRPSNQRKAARHGNPNPRTTCSQCGSGSYLALRDCGRVLCAFCVVAGQAEQVRRWKPER